MAFLIMTFVFKVLTIIVVGSIKNSFTRFGTSRKYHRFASNAAKRGFGFNPLLPFSKGGSSLNGRNNFLLSNNRDETFPMQPGSYNVAESGSLSSPPKVLGLNALPFHAAKPSFQEDVNWPATNPDNANWLPHGNTGGVGVDAGVPVVPVVPGVPGVGGSLSMLDKAPGVGTGRTNEESADDDSIDQLLKSFQQQDAAGNIYHHWDHGDITKNKPVQMFQR